MSDCCGFVCRKGSECCVLVGSSIFECITCAVTVLLRSVELGPEPQASRCHCHSLPPLSSASQCANHRHDPRAARCGLQPASTRRLRHFPHPTVTRHPAHSGSAADVSTTTPAVGQGGGRSGWETPFRRTHTDAQPHLDRRTSRLTATSPNVPQHPSESA